MKIYHVVAMAQNRVIGKDNKLPWHFSSDLKFFKQLTTGGTVIMGRKTYESIGKPLPNRENFVVTTAKPLPAGQEHLFFFNSIEDAKKNIQTEKAFIIGGAQVFQQTIQAIDGIYLTKIDAEYEGDTFYPPVPYKFLEKSRTPLQENPKIEVIFYERQG